MKKAAFVFALAMGAATLFQPHSARAEDGTRGLLGVGRIFNNDAIGDGHDRWHTGSYSLSFLRGKSWNGQLPTRFGDLIEYRLGAELVTPASLTHPKPTDRRYAGILSFGMHTHFQMGPAETSLGLDLDMTGPQTGIGRFQRSVHKLLGLTPPTAAQANQIGDAVYPTLVAEMGHSFDLGRDITLRPFVEAEAGIETYVRAGGDVTLGHFGRGDLLVRDTVTGQRYRVIRTDRTPGLSLVLGGDIAHVSDSNLLPAGGAAALETTRKRLRAGLNWQGKRMAAFYGVTWLSREFAPQPEGQVVGSLHISLRF